MTRAPVSAACRTGSARGRRRSPPRAPASRGRSRGYEEARAATAVVAPVSWVFFGAVVLVAGTTAWLAATRPPSRTLFRLVMLAALLLAAQLVASGSALAA